jgi:hypothetical protein
VPPLLVQQLALDGIHGVDFFLRHLALIWLEGVELPSSSPSSGRRSEAAILEGGRGRVEGGLKEG